MDQNVKELKWELVNPVKFIDKEYGEVEVIGKGTFSYQIISKDIFGAAATKSKMDDDTYAKGILLSMIIEEINKYSGKLALSLPGLVKSDNIMNNANEKIFVSLGFQFLSVTIESLDVTENTKKIMKEKETTKIKEAITGRSIAEEEVTEEVVEDSGVKEEELPTKAPSVLGIVLMAVVAAAAIFFLFR